MAMYYQPIEADYIKAQRMEREPGIDLVKCKDGLWRTAEEKAGFDKAADTQSKLIDIPSQITPNQSSA